MRGGGHSLAPIYLDLPEYPQAGRSAAITLCWPAPFPIRNNLSSRLYRCPWVPCVSLEKIAYSKAKSTSSMARTRSRRQHPHVKPPPGRRQVHVCMCACVCACVCVCDVLTQLSSPGTGPTVSQACQRTRRGGSSSHHLIHDSAARWRHCEGICGPLSAHLTAVCRDLPRNRGRTLRDGPRSSQRRDAMQVRVGPRDIAGPRALRQRQMCPCWRLSHGGRHFWRAHDRGRRRRGVGGIPRALALS